MEWMPIETAPKDDTRIIGCDDKGKVSGTYYAKWAGEWRDESEVTDDGYGSVFHDSWNPTLWMPFPDPPEEDPSSP